ncbi:MAG: hypothetical protein H0X67_08740 [Acidobacteria bacterium]|nr:hypothetical protein [Acidobacteriota bacterium]
MNQLSALSATRPGRIVLLLGSAVLMLAAARFWLHDALPHIVDYTEQS